MERTVRTVSIVGFALAAFALGIALLRPPSMLVWPAWRHAALLAALALSMAASLAAALRPAAPRPAVFAATSLCFVVAAAVPWFAWFQPCKALWLSMYAGVAAGAHAAMWRLGPALTRRVPAVWRRRTGFVLVQIAALAVLTEVALRLAAAVLPTPILQVDADVDEVLARYRKRPGELHLGLPCDERGFNDRLRATPGERLVICVGDSFGLGLVPRPFHYTSVAEQQLDGVEVYNAAVIAAGPAEYRKLLEGELLALRPAAIVVALFVGNDIEESDRIAHDRPWLRTLCDREHLRLWTVPQRLLRLLGAAPATPGRAAGTIQGESAAALAGADPAALLARFPWLADPDLEEPTMSVSTFLSVESRRARLVCDPRRPEVYADLWRALGAVLEACAGTPVAVMLIPDEFQVDDALWARIAGPDHERDLPQQRIRAWLDDRGTTCLDLLPAMRAAVSDGARLYHRQDTHWNRRGNEVAGEALAAFLRGWPGD